MAFAASARASTPKQPWCEFANVFAIVTVVCAHQPLPFPRHAALAKEGTAFATRRGVMNPMSERFDERSAALRGIGTSLEANGHGHGTAGNRANRTTVAPHLEIAAELARGSMGRVHFAEDRRLQRQVAVKQLNRDLTGVRLHRESFIAEAKITGQLEHSNVVPVHEVGVTEDGVPYFTMNVVHGTSLAEWLSLPAHALGSTARLQEGVEILLKVCDAVAYAHSRGVIHRDLKPENVMVADFGQVYVIDWGLARVCASATRRNEPPRIETMGAVGTPSHMSPEQARGNPGEMDERSDVFGLGAILYEILSGRSPYGSARSGNVILTRAWNGQVVPIDEAAVGVALPRRIRAIAQKAVAANPAERYQSAVELQSDLRAFLRGGLYGRRETFLPGALICTAGELENAAYLIVEGRCRAFRLWAGRKETLATMQPGDVFGTTAPVLLADRPTSIEAIDRVTVQVLDGASVAALFGCEGETGSGPTRSLDAVAIWRASRRNRAVHDRYDDETTMLGRGGAHAADRVAT